MIDSHPEASLDRVLRNLSGRPGDLVEPYIGRINDCRVQSGDIVWEFETPGEPGTVTFDPDTESLTFVSQGLAINVDPNSTM